MFSRETLLALDPLMRIIRRHEGGYDSFNRGRAGDSPDPFPGGLTTLTVGRIQQLQASGEVFAVGAYQITPNTMPIAVKAAGVRASDFFDSWTQDQLCAGLIMGNKRPALRDYLSGVTGGEAGLDKAQLDLAREWASIPGPDGRGVYDGDAAGNRAHAETKAVRKALVSARERLAEIGVVTMQKKAAVFTATQGTFLKKLPRPSEVLAPNQKVAVPEGKAWRVEAIASRLVEGHRYVRLAGQAGEWYLWPPHWSSGSSGAAAGAPSLGASLVGPAKTPHHFGFSERDSHIVVNDQTEIAQAFNYAGDQLWEAPALARGQGADNEWRLRGSDTPPGIYQIGTIYRDWENPSGTSLRDRMAYGWYSFDMVDLEGQESRHGRSGIMLHGGGSALGASGAWAERQRLLPTLGCIRMHNIDLRDKVLPLCEKGKVYVSVWQER